MIDKKNIATDETHSNKHVHLHLTLNDQRTERGSNLQHGHRQNTETLCTTDSYFESLRVLGY
mgnify:CR=1 FL=1